MTTAPTARDEVCDLDGSTLITSDPTVAARAWCRIADHDLALVEGIARDLVERGARLDDGQGRTVAPKPIGCHEPGCHRHASYRLDGFWTACLAHVLRMAARLDAVGACPGGPTIERVTR
jgi:hypothetical protein